MEIKTALEQQLFNGKNFHVLFTTRRRAPVVCTSMTTTSSRLF